MNPLLVLSVKEQCVVVYPYQAINDDELSLAEGQLVTVVSKAWLPDGYSQIFRSYVFGPSGFWTMAPLRYAGKF